MPISLLHCTVNDKTHLLQNSIQLQCNYLVGQWDFVFNKSRKKILPAYKFVYRWV